LGARVAAAGTAIGPKAVYSAVISGRPVVAWVTSDYARGSVSTWQAWDGSVILWTPTEHAVTVLGITPTYVLINDPWWGQVWKTRGVFEASYATLGDMAVILD